MTDAVAALSQCLRDATQIEGVDAEACAALSTRLSAGSFNLVVAGEFKRGKSSLINALLGAPVLPVAVVPLTSVVTLIGWGETPHATVRFFDAREQAIELDAIADYATEKGNPNNAKGVERVELAWPSDWLKGGIRLVDTPGIGSIHQHNTDVTYRYLPQADAVLFVASVDQPLGRAEADFLGDIRQYADKLFCLLNKADQVSPAELAEANDFATRAVRQALGAEVPVIPVSARLMLASKLEGDAELGRASGLPLLEAELKRLLGEERRAVWIGSMARNLRRILSQTRLVIDLERAALTAPVEELDAKLAAFAARKQEVLQAMSDYAVLFDAGIKALMKGKVEPDIELFCANFCRRLATDIAAQAAARRDLPLKELQAEIEAWAAGVVRQEWEGWRTAEDATVASDFTALCERFRHGIETIVNALSSYSAELFQVPFQAVGGAGFHRAPVDFYYKFWSEPGALYQLGASLLLLLPRAFGAPLVVKRATRYAVELADTQAGRVRHNFDERLKKSAQDFRKEMRAGLEATVAGIENAVARGTELRNTGAESADARQAKLAAADAAIDALLNRLGEAEHPLHSEKHLDARLRQPADGCVSGTDP